MNIRIMSRWSAGVVVYESDYAAITLALEAAVASGANLRGANLRGADLRDADLRGANLRGANLRDADLRDFVTAPFCKWRVYGKGDSITSGCKTKTIAEWDAFFESGEQYETDRKSPEFLRILANYLAQRAWQVALAEGADVARAAVAK